MQTQPLPRGPWQSPAERSSLPEVRTAKYVEVPKTAVRRSGMCWIGLGELSIARVVERRRRVGLEERHELLPLLGSQRSDEDQRVV